MNEAQQIIIEGLWRNNSSLVQLLGLWPLLGVSNTTTNALGLELATTLMLICTNIAVSALHRWILGDILISIYVMIIASVVSMVLMFINAYAFNLYQSLAIFIPLLLTNRIFISRGEAYPSQRTPALAALNGFAIGLGSICALLLLAALLELLDKGMLFDSSDQPLDSWAYVPRIEVFHTNMSFLLAIRPPGAFIGLGFMLAIKHLIDQRMKAREPKAIQPCSAATGGQPLIDE